MTIRHVTVAHESVQLTFGACEDKVLPEDFEEAVSQLAEAIGFVWQNNAVSVQGAPETEEAPVEELTRGQKAARTKAANKKKREAEEASKPPVEEVEQEDVTTRSPEPEPEDDDDFDINAPIGPGAENPDPEPEETHDEISDADLGAEINKKAKLLRSKGDPEATTRVKAAIASFNTNNVDPFTAGMMSQAQRRKFFAKLDAIKAPEDA